MKDFLMKWSVFLWKHKWLYYILLFTWALPFTLVTLLVSLVLICIGKKPIKTPIGWKFQIGKNWGGCDLGIAFIRDTTSDYSLDWHEMGHSFQLCLFGVFFVFIVCIPSAIRYWYYELKFSRKGLSPKTDYDAIWFEESATEIGDKLFNRK